MISLSGLLPIGGRDGLYFVCLEFPPGRLEVSKNFPGIGMSPPAHQALLRDLREPGVWHSNSSPRVPPVRQLQAPE